MPAGDTGALFGTPINDRGVHIGCVGRHHSPPRRGIRSPRSSGLLVSYRTETRHDTLRLNGGAKGASMRAASKEVGGRVEALGESEIRQACRSGTRL
jgi:hypothetical protein